MGKTNVYEVYFDKVKNNTSNDNFSCLIKATKKPTKKQALNFLHSRGVDTNGYFLNFISLYEDTEIYKDTVYDYQETTKLA